MNPRAPHYRYQSSSSSGKDLESIYGGLRNNFVPASASASSASASTPTTSSSTTHNHSLVKYEPKQKSDDEQLLERARNEQLEQNQLAMHTRLLRLTDQVSELMSQRAAFDEDKAQSDQTIKDLRHDVAQLKALVGQHHNKLEVCKRGVNGNAQETQALEQRLRETTEKLEPRLQHHMTRIDRVEGLVRGVGSQVKQHTAQLDDKETRISQLEQGLGGVSNMTSYGGPQSFGNGVTSEAPQLKLSIEKLEKTQNSHESYLKTVGVTLVDQRTRMDTVTNSMDDLCRKQGRRATMDRLMDDILKAHRTILETMFYQLTKEYDKTCQPEDVEYGESGHGLDEDCIFILRQRVLERLSIENKVQREHARLKESQQMFS